MDRKYLRQVQTSVTCFLHHNNDYLFLKRKLDKRIDPGKLNGIGGRVEPGENFLQAAIRETLEETGYVIEEKNIQLSGVVKLEGGYQEDWMICFFKIKVPTKTIPLENNTDDGKLIWLHKDQVLDSEYELVDDLNYLFKDIIESNQLIFATAKLNADQKIIDLNVSKLERV